MRKLFITLSLTLSCPFFNTARPNGDLNYDLIEDIDTVNLEKVEKLLNKQKNISQQQKEKLLTAILQTIKISKEATKSFSESKIDLLRFLLGLTCLSVGLSSFATGSFFSIIGLFMIRTEEKMEWNSKMKEDMRNLNLNDEQMKNLIGGISLLLGVPLTIFGLGISWFGVNQTGKGWNMFSARTRLKKARKIQEIIEKHFGKISVKPAKDQAMQKNAS